MTNIARNAALGLFLGVTTALTAAADDGSKLWLQTSMPDKNVVKLEKPVSDTLQIALCELSRFKQRNWAVMTDKTTF